ncbi:histidine--tRNA ligase [Nanoarchaeota archaeon]
MAYQNPKGTADYYPDEKSRFNQIADSFRKTSRKYGFKEVESPAFESFSLLKEKEGEEIKEQIFTLEKRGNEKLGLRFDLTVPITRMFITKQRELPKPVKWFYCTRMWRYEQPQKGRLREFYQYGVELFGSDKLAADAEVIRLAIDSLLDLGLTKDDFFVKLNNRDLTEGFIEGLGIKKVADIMRLVDKRGKIGNNAFLEELEKYAIEPEVIEKIQEFLEITDITQLKNLNEKAQKALEELNKLMELLEDKREFIKIDVETVRGLAYYTGSVFEIFDTEEKYRALCGGGRYDNLVELFGGQPTSATGFGIGFSILELLLGEKMKLPEPQLEVDYYIAPIAENTVLDAQKLANSLREKSFSVEIDLMQRSLSKQLDYANTIKAKNVVFVGEDEIKEKKFKVKNMESGQEEKLSIEDF